MKRLAATAAFALAALSGAPARAQEAAPPAAAAEPAWGQSTDAPFPVTDEVEPSPEPREAKRQARRRARLERVIAIEGSRFSQEKYHRYAGMVAGGAVLSALGAVGLVTTIGYWVHTVGDDAADELDESGDEDDDGRIGDRRDRAVMWSCFLGGIVGLGIGMPLLILGGGGLRRQKLLRDRHEVYEPIEPTAKLTLFTDSAGSPAGVRLDVRF
jgi:hypothetical protein